MKDTTTIAAWDLPRLIRDLGGPTRVRTLLLAQGMKPVALRNLYAWSSGQSPATAAGVALLCALARRLDPTFDPSVYVLTREEETNG